MEMDYGYVLDNIKDPEELRRRLNAALSIAVDHIFYDGAHHKQYGLDQIVRIISGEKYSELVASETVGEDGPDTFVWDEGIA